MKTFRVLSRRLPTCVLLLVGVTGVVASSCKNNTISSNYNGSTSEAGPVDTTPATTASPSATGTGSAPPSRCTPGTKRCPGGAAGPVLETCAQDGAWVAENCPSAFPLCKLDKCVEECTPNATRCDGDSTQKCQSDRTWGASTPCPASDPICSGAGTCGKTCGAAGDTRCAGNTLETCDGVRTWGSPVACSGATPKCLKDSPAKCGIVDCTPPDESGCLGTTRRTCNPDSTWGAGTPCSGATPACLETPGTPKSAACVECSSGGGCLDARTPKTCVGGAWTPSTPCSAGSECKPATGTCGACTGSVGAAVWTELLPSGGPGPSRRMNARMAYDPVNEAMLLFGGEPGVSGGSDYVVIGDTWQLKDATWTEVGLGGPRPSARTAHAMTTDPIHNKVYMFGGNAASLGNDELWSWNGAVWTQLCTSAACGANRPSARSHAALAYDTARDRLVLVGGRTGSNAGGWTDPEDTWEWDGAAWTRICGPGGAPCGLGGASAWLNGAAYDPARKRVVFLISGVTYEYDGIAWTRPPSGFTAPSFVSQAEALEFDPVRGATVAMGHYSPAGSPTTPFHVWEWNGACWADTNAMPVTNGYYWETMAYDPAHRRMVRFGGQNGIPPSQNVLYNRVIVRSSL